MSLFLAWAGIRGFLSQITADVPVFERHGSVIAPILERAIHGCRQEPETGLPGFAPMKGAKKGIESGNSAYPDRVHDSGTRKIYV